MNAKNLATVILLLIIIIIKYGIKNVLLIAVPGKK